ncbi:MAG: hypothetical protein V7K77_23560 [Nostoc sp.]|uniref:hypothetical protein n=1 Tax=Nostoc sp. TaxID=1180 RepID=UPI002FF8C72E
MTDVINRIAVLAEQRDYISNLRAAMICSGYNPKRTTKELSPEEIERIVPIEFIPPRLSLERIEQITKDFPFYLPLEVYELYQRGNGCLPIGLGEKDWESFNNYFPFPNLDEPFYPLVKAMERYRALDEYREKYDIDPRFFPISEFEHCIRIVIGAEEQQESSPVLTFYTDCFEPRMEWTSLTNMILAWVEVEERGLRIYEKAEREEIKAIWEKYGGRW